MEQTIVTVQLPVHESLEIRKNRLTPEDPANDKGKRICIVTGIHGDELEGQYVAMKLNRIIKANPEYLTGTVDIYPAMNPLGINTITRGIPLFDLDMNRTFPGKDNGSWAEYYTAEVTRDMYGADAAVDIHASNIFLMELPQVRISEETADTLVPMARQLNIDFVWIHGAATVLENTLAHSLNAMGTPCLVVEMGVGMRLTPAYGDQLTAGILNLMKSLDIWSGPTEAPREPIVSKDEVAFINSDAAGIFVPCVAHNGMVKKGQLLGEVVDPLTGECKEQLISPSNGLLFTLREYPVVYPGSLLARILTGGFEE